MSGVGQIGQVTRGRALKPLSNVYSISVGHGFFANHLAQGHSEADFRSEAFE